MTTIHKYRTLPYDQILVRLKKGKRDEYKRAAEELGLSLSMLIQRGVEEYIQNHSGAVTAAEDSDEKKISEALYLVDVFHSFPEDVQDKFLELMKYLADRNNQKQ